MAIRNGLKLTLNALAVGHVMHLILALSLIILIALRVQIYRDGVSANVRLNYAKTLDSQWLEYDDTGQRKSSLNTKVSKLDFLQIENVLWRSQVDSSMQIEVNSATLEILERIHALLPEVIATQELNRLSFLVEKSIPGPSGRKFAKIINSYILYERATNDSVNAFRQANSRERLVLLKQRGQLRIERQIQFFGADTATSLFKQKNNTNEYLDQRMLVNYDPTLSKAEKTKRLDKLQIAYSLTIPRDL